MAFAGCAGSPTGSPIAPTAPGVSAAGTVVIGGGGPQISIQPAFLSILCPTSGTGTFTASTT
jgi:hypothetical protein